MSAAISVALRALVLIVFTYFGFVGYAYALGFLGNILSTTDKSLVYGAVLLQGFVAAALIAAVLCYPMARIFRRHATLAAFIVSSPVLLLRIADFIDEPYWQPAVLFLSAYEIGAYALLLVLGTRLASKRLSSRAHEPEPQQD